MQKKLSLMFSFLCRVNPAKASSFWCKLLPSSIAGRSQMPSFEAFY